ncbi:peptidoglycan-binding domain-containing protein [Nitrosomonas communis]|uniref:Putative peptidoglycan binding domain-containing protein n=1 Tax=Nitrosomonas communis TaxID=44574 RepID=A0A1H2R9T0_9PROT|nr:peptidoglycan-binding domain-containing protein [Nitrosomonas communis]SDW16223.1 Putative peptidoglycan binding domain-containing protein [Nitrosomonas communis]
MSNEYSFKEQPFKASSEFGEDESEFDPETFGAELTYSEWKEGMRGSTPWSSKRRIWGHSSPPLFVDKVEGESVSCSCPVHGTAFVRWVQSSLNQVLGLRLPVTGIMNAAMRSALRRFQQQRGLRVNGIAGSETRRALVEAKKSEKGQTGGLTDPAEYAELLAEASDNGKADAFVADKNGKKYFDSFPHLGNLKVQRITILKPPNFENLMDLILASNQKNFVIDAHGNPNGLTMPLASATRISATKTALFILTGIEYIQSLIRTAKESDTFWERASGMDLERWRRIVEVMHSKIWQQMMAGWPKITPKVSTVDAAKRIVQARLNSLVDSLFPGKVANKQDRVNRLINKMLRLQAQGIREIQFRACNIGKDSNSLYEFRKFFGADHLCAPDVRSGMGPLRRFDISRGAVDRLARNRRTQVFSMPSGRLAILINVLNHEFEAFCAADAQAAVNEWIATHIMAHSTYRRGAFPIHFLQTQPPVFPLDNDYAAHIKCRSSFWESVIRKSEKHQQEIEDYDEREENWAVKEQENEKYGEYIGQLSEEEFEEGGTIPVLSLDKLKIDGLPEITLTLGDSGQYQGFFRKPPSSYTGSVKLSGRVQIEKAGTRRNYDYDLDRSQWPLGKVWGNVAIGGAISSSSASFSSVKRDGVFTTSTWIGYKPYLVRRLVIKVILALKNGKRFGAKVVVELIDLAGFLSIVDPKEKVRPGWQTHLQFLASVRKVFHGNAREPQFIGPFNWILYRHRNVEPLFKFCTPDEERLQAKPKHCNPAQQAAEERLRLYKILYDKGEWLEIGHVLAGIEGSPKQEPNKNQSVPIPIRPELIVTWSGDLGSALQRYIQHFWLATDKHGNPIDKNDPLDLNYYLVREASRSDLIGDVDGINIGSAYDSSRSLADNLNAYYSKKSLRRYHEFIANSKNAKGIAELPLEPGKKPPKLSRQARQTIAIHTHGYLKYFWVTGALYHGTEPAKRKRVDDIMRVDSKLLPLSAEIQQVADYFGRFLEDGLALEQKQGIQPELEEFDSFLNELGK